MFANGRISSPQLTFQKTAGFLFAGAAAEGDGWLEKSPVCRSRGACICPVKHQKVAAFLPGAYIEVSLVYVWFLSGSVTVDEADVDGCRGHSIGAFACGYLGAYLP